MIVDKKVKYEDLLTGDKNALMVAARVLAYGKEYVFEYRGEEEKVDLFAQVRYSARIVFGSAQGSPLPTVSWRENSLGQP